jgi:hypothetical protein
VLTAAEIAAYLGVTPGRVRQLIVQHCVAATGRRGRASLYAVDDIVRHTGARDRVAQAADLR